jgi:hypothetical protein
VPGFVSGKDAVKTCAAICSAFPLLKLHKTYKGGTDKIVKTGKKQKGAC